jgi:hypothetical protein
MSLVAFNLVAQSNGMLRRMALQSEKSKDWYSAAQYYQRLYFSDTTNIKIKYAYAENSRKALDNEVALRLYLGIAADDNGRRFPMSFYWIGQGLKIRGNYKAAKIWFSKFYKLKTKKEELQYFKQRAKQEIEHCDNAQIIKKSPVLSQLDHVDATVNTKLSEFAPYEVDSTLYYSTIRYPEKRDLSLNDPLVYTRIYKSTIKKGKYQKPKMLDTLINSNIFHNANLTYNPTQDFMIMSRCVSLNAADFQCDLYSSRLVGKRWLAPSKMNPPLNEEGFSTTQPHIAMIDSQMFVFFSSNRPGGQGGMDIWYVISRADGSYSQPVNAGKWVNTPEDEVTPWFVNGERSLYFSSTYHGGLGSMDIFKSRFGPNGFTEVANAGYPLNSGHNDLYYSVNEDSKRVYLASNRPGSYAENKNNCCNDIYMFRYDTIKAPVKIDSSFVRREKIKLLVPLTLFFHNDEPDPKTTNTVTTKSYDSTFAAYTRMLPRYEEEFSKDLKKTEKQQASDLITNFFTDSVQVGMEELRRFVDLMVPLLRSGETVKITMKGYCSPLASTNYNKNLARRRISSLRNYFNNVDNGKLRPFIQEQDSTKGRIVFEDVDIGELRASKVSDSFKDRRMSVFSPYASAERKIQIIAVSFGKEAENAKDAK